MRKLLMSVLVLVLAFCILLPGFAFANESTNGTEKVVDGFIVELVLSSEEVKTGSNELMVKIHDSNDAPVEAANVKVTVDMDKKASMGGHGMEKSEPVVTTLETGSEKGQYMGKVNFTDKGMWTVKVTFAIQDQEKQVDFETDVSGSGPNWTIIGGFLGFILLIIVIAAIMKKRSPQVSK